MTWLFLMLISANSWAQTSVTEIKTPNEIKALPPMEWAGDIRLRGNELREDVDDTRRYSQLRVRLGVKADINSQSKAIVRLASASSAISTNQTLGDSSAPGMVRRGFGLDLAYFDWKFHDFGHVWLGRTANPFWAPNKVQTLFDADLSFEGVAFKWEPQWSASGAFINGGAYIISENYVAPHDSVDVGLVGLDVGYKQKIDDFTGTFHVGTYHYLNIKNCLISCVESGGKVDPYSSPFERYRGNTVYAPDPVAPIDTRYFFKHQYTLFNAGFEGRLKLKGGAEVAPFVEYVKNYAIGGYNDAQEYGINIKWHNWGGAVARIDKDMDSVVGAFTDSDSNGGGTDNEGYRFQLSYLLAKNTTMTVTQFEAKRAVDTVKHNFKWTQVDLSVSF